MKRYCNACELWELLIRKFLGFFMVIVGAGGLFDTLPAFISRHAQPFVEAGFHLGMVEVVLGAIPFIDLLLGVGLLLDKTRCVATRILGILTLALFVIHFFWNTGNYIFPSAIASVCLMLVILQSQSKSVCSW